MCTKMADRLMAFRDSMPPEQEKERFVDVRMDQLTADPIGTIRAIYDRFNIPFTPEFEAALHAYVAEHGNKESSAPTDAAARSAHRGTLEKLGLTDDVVDARFRRYRERYLS